ncbi:MAG TPA: alpha-1,4-glucan--maltose-1-phosphate maltosyltransferase [Dehalococcoidia bacterium]|nr:alpha-1,4-glucan--maltose-1-phosphate maltosyltransferase [Dehalococcoidia bacterium]
MPERKPRTRSAASGAVDPSAGIAADPGPGAAQSNGPSPERPSRVVIENVRPEVDQGRFPAKTVVGDTFVVEADVYCDGHDMISADLLYKAADDRAWKRVPMIALYNDRWRSAFVVRQQTAYTYTIEGWIDRFLTWRTDFLKRIDAGHDIAVDLQIGASIVREAAEGAPAKDAEFLRNAAARIGGKTGVKGRIEAALDPTLHVRMRGVAGQRRRYMRDLRARADGFRAAFSTWYELFPRSTAAIEGEHGTFRDVERRLKYVAEMGFDVLYLPPIHPIGRTKRKGANNTVKAKPGDPGSPWAIGSKEGGHKDINPELGTLADFKRLVNKARQKGIEVALDIAFQCSPDHPYVKEHPEWFIWRPDGTVQYAENPPKKYEDIYPFNFETEDWQALWQELLSIFLYWVEQGVRIFRVDNPHTKPFRFWEWLIGEVDKRDPGVIFLAEAFTRPRIMHHLAKLGFTQSYTYFTWRNDKQGLIDYFTELTQTPVADFYRPNAWPNTPDILHEYLQHGGRSAFVARLVLAATLSANYGMYGPAFELMEATPREPGSEEYLHSEKYQLRHWDFNRPDSLRDLITLVNRARHDNTALQSNRGLRFLPIDNGQLIAYARQTQDASNVVIVVVNLDTQWMQSGWLNLPLADWGIADDEQYQVHDLLSDARYIWQGPNNFVQLDPGVMSAHVFRLRRRKAAGWEFK